MESKELKYHTLYMDIAKRVAEMSHCERKKVGSVIVKDNNIISYGWNGMPSGMDNCCEDELGNTRPEVIHAEDNGILKLAKSHNSSDGSTLYITLSPCIECGKAILQAGITSVYYDRTYKCVMGIDFLKKNGVKVYKL